MGILATVYHNPDGDCTNNGISSGVKNLVIVNVPGPFEPARECPAAMLVPGLAKNTVRIVPAAWDGNDWKPATGWWMMGGNYLAGADSRFTLAVEKMLGHDFYGAVAIHDRMET